MKRMKRLAVALGLAAGLTSASPADAQTLYTCGDGTVRSVQSVTENVVTQIVPRNPDNPVKSKHQTTRERKPSAYLVTVQLYGVVYTGQSPADAPWNLDPTLLGTDEAILVCANDGQMILDRRDGTDYRAKIVRAGRDTRARKSTGTR